jgi:hypothetical protein
MPYNRKIFTVDWEKMIRWLINYRLRKPRQIAWLNSLLYPLTYLYNLFLAFRKSVVYRLNITPQVCYLEKALNDRYDIVLRRIRIVDGKEMNPIPLFQKVENKKQVLFTKGEDIPLVLYTKEETAQYGVDFIILMPLFLPFDYNELRAFMETISKLTTRTYRVQFV